MALLDVEPAAVGAGAGSRYWAEAWWRLRHNWVAMICLAVIIAITIAAIAAPLISAWVTHYGPDEQGHLLANFAPPGGRHLLGTDELGRDTLTRLAYGARASLGVGFLAAFLYITIGAGIGLVSGYAGRRTDFALMRGVDVLLAIPPIFLLMLIGALLPLKFGPVSLGHNAGSLAAIIAVTAWGPIARLMRAEAQSLRDREYVLAARLEGASARHIIRKNILPNTMPTLIVAASLGVGQVILIEAALDFLGIGIQEPTPSWGNMMLNAQSYYYESPWLVVLPGACIAITVLALTLFGNALRDALDPRLVPVR